MTRNGLKHMDYDDALINTELCFSILVSTSDDLRKHYMNPACAHAGLLLHRHIFPVQEVMYMNTDFTCAGAVQTETGPVWQACGRLFICYDQLQERRPFLFHDAIILVKKARFRHDHKYSISCSSNTSTPSN